MGTLRTLRVMTANMLQERSNPEAFAHLLDRVQPDVVFLQEMTEGPAEVLADRYDHCFLFPSKEYEGRGVASRHEADCGSLYLPWRPGTFLTLELAGQTVTAAGVHMSNPIMFPWWRSIEERKAQLEALLSWSEELDTDALLIAGDFNATPIWPLYRRLANRFDDLPKQAAEAMGVSPDRTWGWRPGWPRMLRIDHVFGSGVAVAGSNTERVVGSDHYALVVDLEIGESSLRRDI